MTNATTTNAIQPQIAVFRCCALHRPARAANVFACTRLLLEREAVKTCVTTSQSAGAPAWRPCGTLASNGGDSPLTSVRVRCHHVGRRRLHPDVTASALPLLSFVREILDALH